MSSQVTFPPRLPLPSNQLPLTIISLDDWALVTLNGADTVKYLQGQLTCDVTSLNTNHFSFSAHCDAKGKMLAYLCLFYYHGGMAFIERRSVRNSQLNELKKYAIFSNTTINADDNVVLLGVAGFQAQMALSKLFTNLPNSAQSVAHYQDTTLLYFGLPTTRFLLITTPTMLNTLQHTLENQAQHNNSQQWLALDIEAGYPIIDITTSAQFIPQAANVQALGGISFNKGCYIGQEIVARAKYHRANKRAMYWLAGKSNQTITTPAAGDNLERKIGSNWRRTGTVLAACQLDSGSIWLQAILNNDLTPDTMLRIRHNGTCALHIMPLPYVIDE